jgi:hypothetical protein
MVLEVINQKKKINNICLFYTLLYGFIQLLTNPKIITIPTIYLIRKTCVVGRININDSLYPNFFDIDSYIFYENK